MATLLTLDIFFARRQCNQRIQPKLAVIIEVFIAQRDTKGPPAAISVLQAEDAWFEFLGKANDFLVAYGKLSPNPRVFEYKMDRNYVGSIIPYGKTHFECSTEEIDWRQYSQKIREILDQHLKVTRSSTVMKLRSLADPRFWEDFEAGQGGGDLQTAAEGPLHEAAAAIDDLYRTDVLASPWWQDKPEISKKLTQLVRRIIHPLGLGDWEGIASNIDHYAARHYAQP